MTTQKVFISYKADIELLEIQAVNHSDNSALSRLSFSIDRANEIVKSWVILADGELLGQIGASGRCAVAAEHLDQLPVIHQKYADALDCKVAIGVGLNISESDMALEAAELNGGGKIKFYTDEIKDELEEAKNKEESPLAEAINNFNKSEQHPLQGQFQQIIQEQQDDEAAKLKAAEQNSATSKTKMAVVQILQQVRQNSQELEAMKEEAPHLYNSIMSMTQALIMLAKQLQKPTGDLISGGKGDGADPSKFDSSQMSAGVKEEMEEHTDNPKIAEEIVSDHLTKDPEYYSKSEQIKGKAKKLRIDYPIGFIISTGSGTILAHTQESPSKEGGRIRIKTVDGRKVWRNIKDGMIMDQETGEIKPARGK